VLTSLPVRASADRTRNAWVLALLAAACAEPKVVATDPVPAAAPDAAMAPPVQSDAATADAWVLPPVSPSDGPAADLGAPGPLDVVYAHSGSTLFRVDPQTLTVSRIGPFTVAEPNRTRQLFNVTDIAVDRARRIVGLTYEQLLEIDGATGACKVIAPLPMGEQFNGLSWIRSDNGPEALVATSVGGGVFRIDPATGTATSIGTLGGGLESSGDLVSVDTYGTLVTVKGPTSDRLARLDPATGAATVIGEIGFVNVWGLGFWKNRVFGFTNNGGFILIDPKTGAGTLSQRYPGFAFFGAGVTTEVPVMID
jgi:hypothetical protein